MLKSIRSCERVMGKTEIDSLRSKLLIGFPYEKLMIAHK